MPSKFKYEILAEVLADGNVPVTKYKSDSCGLTVCIAEVNGPLVGGYFTVATETFDDDGLPHTLEHLVFLGSEKYPYKGVLDLLATRCLAQGTNAWTDTDHTCYTITTAGDEGFYDILPIYLDHLLYPKLTDAAYTTEVHHITGEGEDAGVVYSELLGRENSGIDRCYIAMLRALYPGHCGYSSETGGLMKNIRESTTNEKVRAYHKEFYRPENLCCIIIGKVKAEKVFEALIPVEERILKEAEKNEFVRPWQTPVPPLTESVIKEVYYPTDDDDYGMFLIAWRGPKANDFQNVIAVQILLDYFTDTSIAPINRDFVEIEEPLCNEVDYSFIENSETCFYLHFSSVPVAKLPELTEKLLALLKSVVDRKEEIDMSHLATLIQKKKLYILSNIENSPHDAFSGCLIGDFLYGYSAQDFEGRLKEIPIIESLLEKDDSFWLNLIKTYLIDSNYVSILGYPSSELSDKLAEAEKERIKQQQSMLGPEGLKQKADILQKAIETNQIPVPEEVLASVKAHSVKSIQFHPIKRTCNIREFEGDDVEYSINKMPCRFQVDCVQTNFVRLYILLNTDGLEVEDRMYLPLLIELLDESAVMRNGEIVPYQDVVKQLARDTVSICASIGLSYSRFFSSCYAQIIKLSLMVEEEKYAKSVEWIREILYQICLEPSRIKSTINKMISDVSSIKQSGSAIVKTMMKNLCFTSDSNHWTSSVFRQSTFLTKLLKELENSPKEVISRMNKIRNIITKEENIIVHLALNLDSIKKKTQPEDVWEAFTKVEPSKLAGQIVRKCSQYIRPFSEEASRGFIAGLGSLEASYLIQSTICSVEEIREYSSLLVLCSYFIQSEGPMWKQIRGCGYAYAFNLYVYKDTGLIYFTLSRATHLVKAYKEALSIINSFFNGAFKWDLQLLESARCALLFELIESMKTVGNVVSESLRAYCRNCHDFTKECKELLKSVSEVTTQDMERVGEKYLKPLFNPELSWCAVTCNPKKVDYITKEFKNFSWNMTAVPSVDTSFMSEY